MKLLRLLPILLIGSLLAFTPVSASAYDLEEALRELQDQYQEQSGTRSRPDYRVAQRSNGKSLSEAVEQVRRQTKGRILSAETRVQGNREVHYIKVLTDDGRVSTHTVQGRKRGG